MATRLNHDHPSRPIMIALRSLLVASVLGLSLLFIHPTPAFAYSCGTPQSNHCYSIWQNNLPFDGMQGSAVNIYVAYMDCVGCGANFIDNEMWLAYGHTYWVEAGYAVDHSQKPSQYYFWADKRPIDGTYHEHPMDVIPGADYSHNTYFSIFRTAGYTDRFTVVESGWTTYSTGLSTQNTMTVNNVQMGMELSGSSGATAANAYYTGRQCKNDSGVWKSLPAYNGYYAQDPPTHINQSGTDFYTYCTC